MFIFHQQHLDNIKNKIEKEAEDVEHFKEEKVGRMFRGSLYSHHRRCRSYWTTMSNYRTFRISSGKDSLNSPLLLDIKSQVT